MKVSTSAFVFVCAVSRVSVSVGFFECFFSVSLRSLFNVIAGLDWRNH